MGNQLSGVAPAQILSVDSYFNDLTEFQLHSSLGSTRFLKVARAKYKEGYVVIKVFVIHDPSLPLKSYQDQILNIAERVKGFPNVLPFQRTLLTERAGLLVRQYVHDNLYDRISTRPFLNLVEKKWIVFQLLCALEQIHGAKVYHGDIKAENTMMTSWNWVLLTDLATFKPVYLPVDNPADFNYFFDTSRRRTCNIAPERFVETTSKYGESINAGAINDGDLKRTNSPTLPLIDFPSAGQSEMTAAMDIFSAGCVVAELFCEGSPLFDLSQLLAYKNGDYNPEVKLSKIDNNIRDMIKHMISKDPNERLSAKEYMNTYRGHVFPEEFYTFLKGYLSKFASCPVMTPDEKIVRIHTDIKQIKQALLPPTSEGEEEKKELPESDNCFVMICSLVTSYVRTLKFSQSKLIALDLMLELAHFVSDEVILERLLPYMFYLVNDRVPRVRAQTIGTIAKSLELVKNVPRSESNIFPEYILTNLNPLASDSEVIVQVAFAENIASLAETALRFLEIIQLNSLNTETQQERETQFQYQGSYDVELQALHELIQSKVVALLTNSDNIVKRTLLERGLTRLCVFFGRQKANDVLLSHIITFLNDKNDWHLRAAFFDNIVGVAAYIGVHSITILKPLLQQGLKDIEEFVVCRALHALTSLAELGLLQKPTLNEYTYEVVPFFLHPNDWIRYAAVGYVSTCAKVMNIADVYCSLMPAVKPYLKQPIIQLENETILLSILQEQIPRAVFDSLVKSQHTRPLFQKLESVHCADKGNEKESLPVDEALGQTIRRLKSQGMTDVVERKLLRLREVILKLNNGRASSDKKKVPEVSQGGILDLGSLDSKPDTQLLELKMVEQRSTQQNQKRPASARQSVAQEQIIPTPTTKPPPPPSPPKDKVPEAEDKVASTKEDSTKDEIEKPDNDGKNASQTDSEDSKSPPTKPEIPAPPPSQPVVATPQLPQTLTDQPKYARCKLDLHNLAMYKKTQYLKDTKSKSLIGSALDGKGKQSSWRPKGQLVAHLHEHKASINKIAVSHDCAYFATASNDQTVKIWETQRLDGKALTNRSKMTYSRQVGKINCLTFCQNSYTLACSSDDASIHVARIETIGTQGQTKLPLLIEKKLNVGEEGLAVDMHHFDTGAQSIIAYATVHGYICGWDLRIPKERYAWRFKNDSTLGLISSFAVDPFQCWLCCGTSDGAIVCWDMRFQMPITTIRHPRNARVRRVSSHPIEQSWVVATFQGNNEVSMWDLETSARRQTLWASLYPPLSQTQVSNEAILSLQSADQDNRPYFITGGTDRRIRIWDLQLPENSSIVAAAATDNLDHVTISYTNRLIDGTEVIYETCERKPSHHEESPRRGPDEPQIGHHDCITDIALTKLPQNFVISGSMDGVIKVWK